MLAKADLQPAAHFRSQTEQIRRSEPGPTHRLRPQSGRTEHLPDGDAPPATPHRPTGNRANLSPPDCPPQ